MTTPTTAAKPSAIAKLLAALNDTMSNPQSAGLTGFAQGLLQASEPHMLTPVSGGQALGMGAAASQQYQHQALQNALQRAVVPFQMGKTLELERALANPNDPNAQAVGLSLVGVNPMNVPSTAQAVTAARNAVTPTNVPAGAAAMSALRASQGGLPVRGPTPPGSLQSPQTGAITPAPGAYPAIAGAAGAQAGGAAAAAFPYNQALKVSGYFKRSPGEAGGFSLPMPPLFNPAFQSGGQPPRSNGDIEGNPSVPGSLAAGKESGQTPEGRARLAATVSAAAQASRPVLSLPPRAGASAQPVTGNGLTSAGLSPAQIELQKQAAQQTGVQEAEAGKETEAANQQLARLGEMQQALNRIPLGGNLGKIYDGIANALNYAGVKLPGLAAMQSYEKYRTNFVADAARKMGAKVSYQEVNYIARGVPDFTLAGNAPRALLGQLQGASQYDIARNQAMKYYATSVPNLYGRSYQGTIRGFEQWWQKTGVTPGLFMFFSTMDALPAAQRAQYAANFENTATGKMYFNQYRKGQAFLKQNPQLVPFLTGQQ